MKRKNNRNDKRNRVERKVRNAEKSEPTVLVIDGIVEKVLPNAVFQVRIAENHLVLAHVSGKMRMNYIRLLPGDRVAVEMSPYDKDKGRIKTRYRS
ncbi:MAG: translation initiation factor IF-1 [Candidatus Dependentiae bacterium]|jgi:translation initiation factor IF-1